MLDTPSTVRTPSSFAAGQRLQRLGCAFLLSAGGQAETVNVDILVRDACGVGGVYNAAGNGDAAPSTVGGMPPLSSARPTTAAPYFYRAAKSFPASQSRR